MSYFCTHDAKACQCQLQKYQQLAYEIREKRPGYHVDIIPVVIGCMRRGANKLREQIAKVLEMETEKQKITRTWSKMIKTVLAESERLIRKVLSNIITAVSDEERWPANLGGLFRHNWPYEGYTPKQY